MGLVLPLLSVSLTGFVKGWTFMTKDINLGGHYWAFAYGIERVTVGLGLVIVPPEERSHRNS